jgi:hypothetical protein
MQLIEEVDWLVTKACRVLELNPDRFYRWQRAWRREKPAYNRKPFHPHAILPKGREAIINFALEKSEIRKTMGPNAVNIKCYNHISRRNFLGSLTIYSVS